MRRALSLTLLLALAATPALSARVQDPEDLSRLQAQHRDEQARARKLRADADTARAEIARLERRLSTLKTEQGEGDATISTQRARLDELSRREAELVGKLSAERGRLARLLSGLQMMSRRPPPPLLVPASKATDTVRASILMRAIEPELERRARALAARQGEIVRLRREAALASEALFTAETDQLERNGESESLLARRTQLLAVLRAEADQAERAARALEARIRALGGQPLPAEEGRTREIASSLPGGRSNLSAPVPGAPDRRFGQGSGGWAWRMSADAEVNAPADGVVAYAGPLEGWGQVVILDLGPGWRVVLAGLDTTAVTEGQRIGDGATVGAAKRGDDLYLELRRDERPVDPARWLQ